MDMTRSTVALSPHNDDLELFASQLLTDYTPYVVVVFRSHVQELRGAGITSRQRERETGLALEWFGIDWEQWPYPDSEPLSQTAAMRIRHLAVEYERCICPAVEEGGHDQHNAVGQVALMAFGHERTIRYLTYRRGEGRSTNGREMQLSPDTIRRKHRALAEHATQIKEPSTRPWFVETLREWVA
jgi:LmbE family N-acetylglucosaminyl deacetylase